MTINKNFNIWILIFSVMYINVIWRDIAQNNYIWIAYRYVFIGMLIAITKAVYSIKDFKPRHFFKVVFCWLPGLWIEEVIDWVNR